MFGKKKDQENKKTQMELIKNIRVIPEDFYGGKDPVIYHTAIANKSFSDRDTKARDIKKPVQGVKISKFAGRKFMLIATSAVFVIGVVIGSVYYLRPIPTIVPTDIIIPPVVIEVPVPEPEIVETVIETVPEAAVVTTTSPWFLEFPKLYLTDSSDMDSDSLTDFEEEVFGTDPAIWDTDNDGYYDGQELVNLYNPRGFAPVKLIDSGLVAEYINPTKQYRVYYPINWQAGEVDSDANQVLFSTITGDFIELSVFQMGSSEGFTDWFAREAKGEQFTDLVPFTNRFQEPGYKRKDGLVSYFTYSGQVFVFIYHPSSSGVVSYRHVMQMMFNSFRPRKSNIEIPDQVILPGVVSTEGVEAPTVMPADTITDDVENDTSVGSQEATTTDQFDGGSVSEDEVLG